MAQYLNLTKQQQDERNGVGGFVAGTSRPVGQKRSAAGWTNRAASTLCTAPANTSRRIPPLRVVIPTDRTVSAKEYKPVARKIAQAIGLNYCDPTTFEVSRLMYWPSCCADSQFVAAFQDRPLLLADAVLAQCADWRDCANWPRPAGAAELPYPTKNQSDPALKRGVVGAFCRTYGIPAAIEHYLSGRYGKAYGMKRRYTYLAGSTTGGAIEDGQ